MAFTQCYPLPSNKIVWVMSTVSHGTAGDIPVQQFLLCITDRFLHKEIFYHMMIKLDYLAHVLRV